MMTDCSARCYRIDILKKYERIATGLDVGQAPSLSYAVRPQCPLGPKDAATKQAVGCTSKEGPRLRSTTLPSGDPPGFDNFPETTRYPGWFKGMERIDRERRFVSRRGVISPQ